MEPFRGLNRKRERRSKPVAQPVWFSLFGSAMNTQSVSAQYRQEGNKKYLSVTSGLAPVLKRSRLVEAIGKYNAAYNHADSADEKALALKNLAMANSKLAGILPLNTDQEILLVRHHVKNAIESFSKSNAFGKAVKTIEWLDDLCERLNVFLSNFYDMVENLEYRTKVSLLEEVYAVELEPLRGEWCLRIAEMMFHESLRKLTQHDFKQGLTLMRDCYRPMEEAARSALLHPAIQSELDVMKQDLVFHTCTLESHQALSIDLAMAWEALDWYKKAALATREIEVEMEAIALSRIGKLYDEVFALKSKAKENFKRAIELAMSMHPRTFNDEEWYTVCTETLEKYQKEQVEQENEKWNLSRMKYLQELQDVLKKIDAQAKVGDITLLKWVYKTHPPKQKDYTLPEKLPDISEGMESYHAGMKKVLKLAVVHYHPDRCDVAAHGEKWKVLSEEICMRLTKRYESFK